MATKAEILQAIRNARTAFKDAIYGKDVRQGLVDVADSVYDAVNQWGALIDDTLTQEGQAADAKAVGENLKNNAVLSGYERYVTAFAQGAYSQTGVEPNTGRAYYIATGITRHSKIYFDAEIYRVNYYYIESISDFTLLYSPNVWNDTGSIDLNYNGETVFIAVKRLDNHAISDDDISKLNGGYVQIFKKAGAGVDNLGIISGTTLASNNKIGVYSVPAFTHEITAAITDMPVSNFEGGFLVNLPYGGYENICKILIELAGSNRAFQKVGSGNWSRFGVSDKVTGKKWVAFGDSITHGSYSTDEGTTGNGPTRSYVYRTAMYLRKDILEFTNCGVRGIGWINTGNNGETMADMLAMFTGDKTQINLVTIMLGINDYLSNETLGSTDSAENDGTISGAIRYVLRYLSEEYYNAKIIVISPLNSTARGTEATAWSRETYRANPGTLQDVADMIKYWCDKYGIMFIDELSQGFINSGNAENWLKDTIHPTDAGQWMLAHEIASKMGD